MSFLHFGREATHACFFLVPLSPQGGGRTATSICPPFEWIRLASCTSVQTEFARVDHINRHCAGRGQRWSTNPPV